ncbi:MAG: ATP-binding protein [Armatimonadetes bacterium]|nr:ATP-binding protein [Armatimonadota bacterium]
MRNLRKQLLASHSAIAVLMLAVIVAGIAAIFHLGGTIDRILENNYRSVVAAQTMKEALERMDGSATFWLAGRRVDAADRFATNGRRFGEALHVELNNITEPGERSMADATARRFDEYEARARRLFAGMVPGGNAGASAYYVRVLNPAFLAVRERVNDIHSLNQTAILRADDRAKREARLASWAGIVAVLVAAVLALVFGLRMVGSTLAPLLTLTRQAEEIGAGHLNQRIDLHRSDEMGTLAEALNKMTERLREARSEEAARLHRAERMSDEALDSLYDPVLVCDAEGRVVQINRAAEGLFGAESNWTGAAIEDVTSESGISRAIREAVRQEQTSASEDEYVNLHCGSDQRVYRLRVTPMRDDNQPLLGAVAVLEDVTHLRELDRLKAEFIGVASHELRTPVTSLMLSVQLLSEGAAGELSATQAEIVDAQKHDLKRLDRTMRDLLDLTRLETGIKPPDLTPQQPAALVGSAVEAVAATAAAKGLALTVEHESSLPAVSADEAQLVRALTNLLDNAVRHTPDGGRVTASAARAEQGVRFSVSDTGPGIPQEYQSRIFDRFVQVPGSTRGGAGLGLSIAQSIVASHGGSLSLHSDPGRGCLFQFTLPAIGVERT